MNFNWILGNGQLEDVDSYKYLGFDIKNNSRWNEYRERVMQKARKNMKASWSMRASLGETSSGIWIRGMGR